MNSIKPRQSEYYVGYNYYLQPVILIIMRDNKGKKSWDLRIDPNNDSYKVQTVTALTEENLCTIFDLVNNY